MNWGRFLKRSVIAASLIFIGFVGGTYFGFGFAVSYMQFGNYVPGGFLATAQLLQLEKNNPAPAKMDLESKVDMALTQYSFASEEWWFPLYEDGWLLPFDPGQFEESMRYSATYRKSHTSPYRDAYTGMKGEELAEAGRNYLQRMDAMVERFAEKEMDQ